MNKQINYKRIYYKKEIKEEKKEKKQLKKLKSKYLRKRFFLRGKKNKNTKRLGKLNITLGKRKRYSLKRFKLNNEIKKILERINRDINNGNTKQ